MNHRKLPAVLLLGSLIACARVMALPAGYLDVTTLGADPTGAADATAAIQQGINQARDTNQVLWFPGGTYRVSDRLLIDQPDNDSSLPVVLMGSTVDPQNRATLYLAPNSPGFGDAANRKVLVHFFNIGPPESESGNADLYNQAIIGLDIKIGSGNAGAVALRLQGAEGCTIQDVAIDLTEGGHTGIWGIPGSGGSTHRVTITGGEYGIDTRYYPTAGGGGTQPTAVVTGSSFINQRSRALFATTRGSFVLIGCRIEKAAAGPAISLQRNWPGQPFDASLQLIDCSIEYPVFNRLNIVIEMTGSLGRSFYFNNTWVKNARRLWGTIASNNAGWTHFRHAANEVKPESRGWWQPEEPVWLDGVRHGETYLDSVDDDVPPSDLQSRHQWAAGFPTWETPGVVDVTTLGAVGDGVTDNWAVLQQAIDEHETLFFPKGVFMVSKTLDLRPDSKLVGVYPIYSVISALSTLQNRFAGVLNGQPDQPIIRTADTAAADTILAFLHIRRTVPLAQHNPTPPGNYAIEWRCAGDSLTRHIRVETRMATNIRPDLVAKNYYGLVNSINPNHPQADFPAGMYAWPCDAPTVQIRGNGGGRWFNTWMHGRQALREDTPFLRVEGTTQPLHFYHLHLQQQDSRNHAEILNARNLSIYGTKAELKGALVYFENCDNVRLFGNGGISSPDHNYFPPYLFRFINCDNFLISGLGDTINEGGDVWVGGVYDRWLNNHFRNWYPVQDKADGRAEVVIPSAQRPILYMRGDPHYVALTAPPAPWQNADGPVGGLYQLNWFGAFAIHGGGWIWHLEHGAMYTPSTSTASLWLWDPQLGYLWTSDIVYPFHFRVDSASWLYYFTGGSPAERVFFDFDPATPGYITIP